MSRGDKLAVEGIAARAAQELLGAQPHGEEGKKLAPGEFVWRATEAYLFQLLG
ncbi:hypothetical protein BS78_02G222100 [Paspalum vaginatum]|nr:hypothetical protein BS78_02G222100 [Paspalum vaginatum]